MTRSHFWRVLGLVLFCLAAAGCESGPSNAGPGSPPELVVLESRIDAVPGRTLVVPVRPGRETRERVPVVLEDRSGQRRFEGRLWRVVVAVEPGGSSWLPPSGAWRAEPFDPRADVEAPVSADRPALVSTMVAVDLPLDIGPGWLTIGGARVRFNVLGSLAAPGTLTGREEAELVAGAKAAREIDAPAVARLLEPERRSPSRRWRYRLLAGSAMGDVFSDPVVEAIAAQEEARWSWALRALARADREVAARLAARLVAITVFEGGATAPTWPVSTDDLASLLSDLLDPALDGARRAERAGAFLLAQPTAMAWVIDDGGTPDAATGRPMIAVGIANLSARPVLTGVSGPGVPLTAADPLDLAAWTAQTRFVAVPEQGASAPSIGAVIGSWRRTLPVLAASLPATPPGVALGPLLPDFTLDTWAGGAASGPPDPARTCAAMLLRKDRAWTLYIECKRPADDPAPAQEDTVRVWIGPTARPRLVMRIGESGYAHVEQELPALGGRAVGVKEGREGEKGGDPDAAVASRSAKWVGEVTIPDWCIEEDGTLRIGIERINGLGARSAYPRAMLPWQTEPGRVMVDTRGWGG